MLAVPSGRVRGRRQRAAMLPRPAWPAGFGVAPRAGRPRDASPGFFAASRCGGMREENLAVFPLALSIPFCLRGGETSRPSPPSPLFRVRKRGGSMRCRFFAAGRSRRRGRSGGRAGAPARKGAAFVPECAAFVLELGASAQELAAALHLPPFACEGGMGGKPITEGQPGTSQRIAKERGARGENLSGFSPRIPPAWGRALSPLTGPEGTANTLQPLPDKSERHCEHVAAGPRQARTAWACVVAASRRSLAGGGTRCGGETAKKVDPPWLCLGIRGQSWGLTRPGAGAYKGAP